MPLQSAFRRSYRAQLFHLWRRRNATLEGAGRDPRADCKLYHSALMNIHFWKVTFSLLDMGIVVDFGADLKLFSNQVTCIYGVSDRFLSCEGGGLVRYGRS